MPEHTATPRLSPRFDEALAYASALHRTQTRKGGGVPYVGNLLSVASLVIEGGGSETQAIAGLLHDAVEDQGGAPVLADELDNARAILRDYRTHGDDLWQRFSTKDPQEHLWYYRALHAIYRDRNDTWLVDELDRVLGELENLVAASPRA